MEKKNNNGLIVTVVILVLLVLGLGGYITYDKVLNKDVQAPVNEEKNDVKNEITKLGENREVQELNFNMSSFLGKVLISKDGNAYIFVDSVDSADDSCKEAVENLKKQYQNYTIEGYRSDYETETSYFTGIKLPITDVVSAYNVVQGQDSDFQYIYFVKTDGTVSELSLVDTFYDLKQGPLENNYKTNPKFNLTNNYGNLTDVVSIVQIHSFGAHAAAAVKKDGTHQVLN